jgi:acyltransferase
MKRIFWIDNLKALSVFFVILIHMAPNTNLEKYLLSFVVQLFFYLSGYTFRKNEKDFGKFLKKKLRTLVVPYLSFSLFLFLVWFFIVRSFSIEGKALEIAPLKPFIGIFYAVGVDGWQNPLSTALWFLPCLFLTEIIFYKFRSKYLMPVFMLMGYLVTLLPFRLPWSLDISFTAIIFYGLGFYLKDRLAKPKLAPLFLVLNYGFSFLNIKTDMNYLIYGNLIFFYLSAFFGIQFYIALFKMVKTNKIVEYIGKNTLIIIGFSELPWLFLNGLIFIATGSKFDQSGQMVAILCSLIRILLSVPVIYIINRWFPFVLGRTRESVLV